MEFVDSEYYKSLLWIDENDPSELGLHFQGNKNNFFFINPTDHIKQSAVKASFHILSYPLII